MKVFCFVLFAWFVLVFDAPAQNSSDLDDREIESKVERLLRSRDVGELANELAQNNAATTEDLLIKLSVFARAGHRARVSETLREIGKIYSSSPNQAQIFQIVRRAVSDDDFSAQKIFYEEFALNGDDRAVYFLNAWREKGETNELEKWLKARAQTSETWWSFLLDLKRSLNTTQELTAELEQEIRANPADYDLVRKYLQAADSRINMSVATVSPINQNVVYAQDISWLADVVKTDTAYEAFDLAIILRQNNSSVAVKLLNKSLATPYTEEDSRLFGERTFRSATTNPNVKNPEKQLRVWTKKALVEIYLETNQARLAQPLAEELTATDMSDIRADNDFYNAGAVQSSTGMRVVEAKLLKDEKTNENSPVYWINRAAYYEGRKENALVWKTYQQALSKFPYKPNDLKASLPRLEIIFRIGWRGSDDKETVAILRNEFIKARTANDLPYLYHLLDLIKDEYETLRDEFFVNNELLPQILATRESWSYDEGGMIGNVMESEKWGAKKRDAVWGKLTQLAKLDVAGRAYHLTEVMTDEDEYERAISLLEECLKIAPAEVTGKINFTRDEIKLDLFEIYNNTGDWQKAEKLYADEINYGGNYFSKIAITAAKKGKIADSVRIWKIYANFDRRNLEGLGELAKTEAASSLREFYTEMKTKDALSDAPDKALAILK